MLFVGAPARHGPGIDGASDILVGSASKSLLRQLRLEARVGIDPIRGSYDGNLPDFTGNSTTTPRLRTAFLQWGEHPIALHAPHMLPGAHAYEEPLSSDATLLRPSLGHPLFTSRRGCNEHLRYRGRLRHRERGQRSVWWHGPWHPAQYQSAQSSAGRQSVPPRVPALRAVAAETRPASPVPSATTITAYRPSTFLAREASAGLAFQVEDYRPCNADLESIRTLHQPMAL